jgi:hypothetical protein
MTLAGCGQEAPTDAVSGSGEMTADGPVLVEQGAVAAVRRHRSIVTVDHAGAVHQLAELPDDVGEPDAVVVSEDGRLVLVSAVRWDDDSSVCTGRVLQVLADGASMALSADGGRLAFFRHATVDGFCRRTELVVRKLDSGAEAVVLSLKDAPVGATPPSWPVSWSPDGTQIAHVLEDGAVVTDLETGRTAPVATGRDRTVLAPVWLPDGRLLVMDGCCIGGGTMASAGTGEVVRPVDAPVRSARPERGRGVGVWSAREEDGLVHRDGATSTQVSRTCSSRPADAWPRHARRRRRA